MARQIQGGFIMQVAEVPRAACRPDILSEVGFDTVREQRLGDIFGAAASPWQAALCAALELPSRVAALDVGAFPPMGSSRGRCCASSGGTSSRSACSGPRPDSGREQFYRQGSLHEVCCANPSGILGPPFPIFGAQRSHTHTHTALPRPAPAGPQKWNSRGMSLGRRPPLLSSGSRSLVGPATLRRRRCSVSSTTGARRSSCSRNILALLRLRLWETRSTS